MSETKVEVWPDKGPAQILPDDILFTDHGVAYVIRPDGSNQRHIAGDRFFCKLGFPSLSRERKQIAFIRDNDMYVIRTDGRDTKKLFNDVIKISRYDYQRDNSIYNMRWSPDGKFFALTGQKDNIRKNCLYLREYNGATRIVKEYDTSYYISSLCWSPDSKKLAYYKGKVISILDIETGNEKPLLTNQVRGGLAWSGDGKKLLTVNDIHEYCIVDAESGSKRFIRCSALGGNGLFWSADEKYALSYTTDYVFIMPVEEYGMHRTVVGGGDARIDGLYW
jgi:Tol biopolymer transport system component